MGWHEVSDLRRFRDWQPTGFDPKGYGPDSIQSWFISPLIRTRDSGVMAESNFACGLKMLGGEGENVEVHRFGHWGPGWFEIILVRPESPQVTQLLEIADTLLEYPLLDDEDFSRREWEAQQEYWGHASLDERRALCAKAGLDRRKAHNKGMPSEVTEYINVEW